MFLHKTPYKHDLMFVHFIDWQCEWSQSLSYDTHELNVLEVLLTLMIIESLTEILSQCHHYSLNVRRILHELYNIELFWPSTNWKESVREQSSVYGESFFAHWRRSCQQWVTKQQVWNWSGQSKPNHRTTCKVTPLVSMDLKQSQLIESSMSVNIWHIWTHVRPRVRRICNGWAIYSFHLESYNQVEFDVATTIKRLLYGGVWWLFSLSLSLVLFLQSVSYSQFTPNFPIYFLTQCLVTIHHSNSLTMLSVAKR